MLSKSFTTSMMIYTRHTVRDPISVVTLSSSPLRPVVAPSARLIFLFVGLARIPSFWTNNWYNTFVISCMNKFTRGTSSDNNLDNIKFLRPFNLLLIQIIAFSCISFYIPHLLVSFHRQGLPFWRAHQQPESLLDIFSVPTLELPEWNFCVILGQALQTF